MPDRRAPSASSLRRSAACITVAVLAAGCADERETANEAEPRRWALVQDLRLDADAENFSLVGPVRVGSHGRIAVGLPQDSEVRLYDAEGRLVSAIGRRGEGPGEFRHMGSLTWLEDTLVVDDPVLRRHTFVDLDGRLLRTRTFPAPFTQASATSSDGREAITFRFFLSISAAPGDEALGIASPVVPPRGPDRVPAPRMLISLGAAVQARLLAIPPDGYDDRRMITLAGRSNPVPFAFQPQIVVSSNGQRVLFASADQSQREGTFQLTVLELDGDTIFHRSYPFAGEPITPTEVDSAVAAMTSVDRFREVARQRIPAVHAPIESVVLALDGTVWVTLRGTATGREVLVLDAEGEPVALVPLPARTRVQEASRTHVYVTETDSLGLISVARYRITGRD